MDRIEAIGRSHGMDPWARRRGTQARVTARAGGKQTANARDDEGATGLSGQRDRVELSPAAVAMFVRWDSGE